MSEKRGKILGTLVFAVLISVLFYLIFFLAESKGRKEMEIIEVTGNSLLDEKDYLSFTMLKNVSESEDLSLPVIKDRFEKHPYVKAADVELSSAKKTKVQVQEKKIMAVILIDTQPYFITEDFQLLPMFMNTKFVDVPVISNPGRITDTRALGYLRTEPVEQAFKIIDAVKMTNPKMSSALSEINLRNGGEIILTFSGLRAPVIFGKNGAAKKMVYLEILWDKIIGGKSLVENSEFIDLRFANEIFIGTAGITELL